MEPDYRHQDAAGGDGETTGGVVVTVVGFQSSFGVRVLGLRVTGAGLGAARSVASTAIIGNVPVRGDKLDATDGEHRERRGEHASTERRVEGPIACPSLCLWLATASPTRQCTTGNPPLY